MTPTTSEGTILYHVLKARYKDPAELKQLMFQIGAASELFQYSEIEIIHLSLIVFLEKHGWLGCLVNKLNEDFPSALELPSKISSLSCPPRIKVQAILPVSSSLNKFAEQKGKLSAIFNIQVEKLIIMAAANNPLRLLLTLPRKHVDIPSVLQNCFEYEDYLLSVTPFRLLSPLAQMAWQHIAWYEPFRLNNDVLTPTTTWQEALLTAVQKLPTPPPHTPSSAEKSSESYPPPIIQPSQPTPPSSTEQPPESVSPSSASAEPSPTGQAMSGTSSKRSIAQPIINLPEQPSSSPDTVEEEE